MTNIEEIWKDVVGYEGYYQVSSMGRVRSVNRIITLKNGTIRKCNGKILSPGDSNGYRAVILSRNHEFATRLVHRLVAHAFLPTEAGREFINHKDSEKSNNNVNNLEWVTLKENSALASAKGLLNPQCGSERRNSKLREEDIPKIRSLYKNGYSQKTISKIYGVQRTLIQGIIDGRRWRHVLFVSIAISLSGCGSAYYLRKAEKAIEKAEKLGATWESDTIEKVIEIPIPEIHIKEVRHAPLLDTLFLTKERLKLVYVRLPGDSVYIEGECESDTVRVEVPVTVTNTIKAPPDKVRWWMWLLIGIGAGVLVAAILKMAR